jgi:tripartite-type tricarboxylate transporter receptor subunit TctC
MNRRDLLGALAASAALPAFAQQPFPNRPIRFVVPFAAGGAPDVIARQVGVQLGRQLGQSVVVENKLGANGIVASQDVARAAPDGHTLLVATGSHTTNPSIYRKLPYDTAKDFAPVTQIFSAPGLVLIVNPKLDIRTPQQFIEAGKAGKIAYGSPGVGNSLHLPGELLNVTTGTKLLHVPYKGASLAVNGVLSGEVQAAFVTPTAAMPLVKAGQVRPLAITSAKRLKLLPDVPTFAEAAIPGFVYSGAWMGLLAPGATPLPILQKLSAEVGKALRTPELYDRLTAEENIVVASTPEDFGKFLEQDMQHFADIVKKAGIQPVD